MTQPGRPVVRSEIGSWAAACDLQGGLLDLDDATRWAASSVRTASGWWSPTGSSICSTPDIPVYLAAARALGDALLVGLE